MGCTPKRWAASCLPLEVLGCRFCCSWPGCNFGQISPCSYGLLQEVAKGAERDSKLGSGSAAQKALEPEGKQGAEPEGDKKDKKKTHRVDEELLQAFRYFDRNCEAGWRPSTTDTMPDHLTCSLERGGAVGVTAVTGGGGRLRPHQGGRPPAHREQPGACAEPAHREGAVPERGRRRILLLAQPLGQGVLPGYHRHRDRGMKRRLTPLPSCINACHPQWKMLSSKSLSPRSQLCRCTTVQVQSA